MLAPNPFLSKHSKRNPTHTDSQPTIRSSGSKFAEMDIKWDYTARTWTTMSGYIDNVCTCFGHPDLIKPKHSPHKYCKIIYGAKEQYTTNYIDTSPTLDVRCGGHQMVPRSSWFTPILCLSHRQQTPHDAQCHCCNTIIFNRKHPNKLLNYCAPNNRITYQASNLVLAAHFWMQASSVNPSTQLNQWTHIPFQKYYQFHES